MAYTPGVARVCLALAEHPEDVRRLTIKGNTVAVVTDGSAVLGLGDIGPGASLPVMEGKAVLFKRFADIDAWPIALDTQDVDEIVRTVELHRPRLRRHQPRGHLGAALLRDREAAARQARHPGLPRRPARDGDRRRSPRCATRCASWTRSSRDVRIVVAGAGAAGTAIVNLLLHAGRRLGARLGPRGHPVAGRRAAVPRQAGAGPADQPRLRRGASCPTRSTAPTCSSASARPTCSPSRSWPGWRREAVVFPMANPTPDVDPVRRVAVRRRRRLGPLGPAEPDQQRAGLPGRLPGPARRAGHRDQRRACWSPRPTRSPPSSRTTSSTPTTSSRRCSTPPSRRRSPPPSPTQARHEPGATAEVSGVETHHRLTGFRAESGTFAKVPDRGRRRPPDLGIMAGCPSCPRWRRWPRSSARTPSAAC